MKKSTFWIILLLLGIALYAGWKHYFGPQQPETLVIDQPTIPAAVEEPPIRYPVPAEELSATAQEAAAPAEKPQPLPPLEESDASLRSALERLFAGQPLDQLLLFDNLAKRVVTTSNNLMSPSLPVKRRPTQSVPGVFMAGGDPGNAVISPENYPRYLPFIQLAQAAGTKQIAAVYVRFYPLLQQAYENLGYRGYFNDRLVEVIDHLLATPVVAEPIPLVRPEVLYQFADPQLEALSSGQKLLLRMGQENATQLKEKLRELRQALTTLQGKIKP